MITQPVDHVDSRPDQPNTTTDYNYSETRETGTDATDLADTALQAAGGDHSVAVTMLRKAVDHVTAGEL